MQQTRFHSIVLVLALVAAAGVQAANEKLRLANKAKAGEVARYKTEASLKLSAGGQEVSFEIKETEKVTFKEVAADGKITAERESEAREASVNGMKLPDPPDSNDKSTVVIRPNGTLVSYKTTSSEPDPEKLSVRMFNATSVIFPDRELNAGDKWTHDFASNTDTGEVPGKAEYEFVGLEKSPNGLDTARIKFTYSENSGNPKLASRGAIHVEPASGDAVYSVIDIENVPFGGGEGMSAMASGKITQQRLSGSPLGNAPATKEVKAEPAKPKTIDEIVKDYKKESGLFTLYRKTEAAKETLYLEIREDQLNQLMMLQATASTGNAETVIPGDPLMDLVFRIESLNEERIVFVVPNSSFTADPKSPVARSVKRAFPNGMVESFKIEARQAERKSLLINISDYFKTDIPQLARGLGGGPSPIPGMPGGGAYSLDREKTLLHRVKMLPENLSVQTAYHFTRGTAGPGGFFSGSSTTADPRSLPLTVEYNLFALKEAGFRPRLADPRVGYFYTETQDFTDDGKENQIVRYILRWNLEKADPKAALSPPKKPITFWIDNATPKEYRQAIREGLLLWNKAFEKVGIKDAIVVNEMPDDADWDHADMRYNVIRWSTTQSAPYGAIALFRVNPLTGEVVNAGITVDAALVRSGKFERRRLVDPVAQFTNAERTPEENLRGFRPNRCEFAGASMDHAWYGLQALAATAVPGNPVDEKAYVHGYLRSIVAHEMGHILGLFHNFIASTELTMEELKDAKKVAARGTVASVMDYFPFNINALKRKGVDYWPRSIGAYDYWAVRYGYSPNTGTKPDDETGWLKKIAAQGNLPGHAFENDFNADSFDPRISRFDLGKDPLEYHARNLEVSGYLLKTLKQREPKTGESYWSFARQFNGLLNFHARSGAQISRYIGALQTNRNHKGDVSEQPTLVAVDGKRQRRALQLVTEKILSPGALEFPKEIYSRFAPNPFPDFASFFGGSADFPMLDSLSGVQRAALRRILSPTVLSRVLNNQYRAKAASETLGLPEIFNTLTAAVWSEVGAARSLTPLRIRLQRSHLETLTGMVVNPATAGPEEVQMLAWDHLRRLKGKLTAARAKAGLEEMTRVHLDESLHRINRALSATQTIGGGGGGGGGPIRIILGSEAPPAQR